MSDEVIVIGKGENVSVPPPVVQVTTPAVLLEKALGMESVSIDKLEKLMELQWRYEENEARKAYHAAMAEFHKVPVVCALIHEKGFPC